MQSSFGLSVFTVGFLRHWRVST